MIKLQQYYVFKLNTSRLNESGCDIENFTVSQARLNGELVSIGDNQVFRMIRNIRNQETDFNKLNEYIRKRNELKLKESSEENSLLIKQYQDEIDKILFVPDIINVKVDDRRVYKKIFHDGFKVNGITYKRFCSGAGQSRRNVASFANTEIIDELTKRLNCGLDIKKINIAKYNAYFGLYMSATYPVSTPRVCIIKDNEEHKLIKTVDWIEDEEYIDENDKKKTKRVIKEKDDFEFIPNMWDGQGLISPDFAEKWRIELDLDYTPSQYGIRSSFIKGMLAVFDFKKFASKVAEKDEIVDCYGDTWNINDIDVILTTSQFKMYKKYSSWKEFVALQKHYEHSWGITKVNPKFDNELSLINYQYIQTLSLDREQIKDLINPTIDWIEKICSGDKLYTLLFLLGNTKDDITVSEIFDKASNNYVKAILYNDKLLNDPYIKKKIYDNISTKIKDAKVGRCWVRGNYQCMISDPYGLAQWAFGMDVTGLLQENEHYSYFWNKRNIKKVDACRSPMVDFHEHNILNFKQNKETDEWYKYIKSGIIYNVWGVDTIRHSDSDWDYDIVFTTDNQIMLNGIIPNKNVITYDKQSAKEQTLIPNNVLKTDLRSFNCKVGTITNYSTTFISMLANFTKNSNEYNELLDRIKLLRRYIGDSIDQAKGIAIKPFPTEWKTRKYIYEDDSEDIKQQKYYHNSLVANKKPYFMIYVYDKLKNEYREYKKKCERTCKEKFGCTLDQLLKKQNKNKQEIYYVSDYYRRMPVLKNNSVMNLLCGMVEEIDFKYKRPKNDENNDEMFEVLYDKDIKINEHKLIKLLELYDKFKKKRHFKYKSKSLSYLDFEIEEDNEYENYMNEFYNEIRNEAYTICPNEKELANHLIYIVYKLKPTDTKEFAWSIGLDGMLSILKDKSKMVIEIPVADKDGVEYLGKKYKLKGVVV